MTNFADKIVGMVFRKVVELPVGDAVIDFSDRVLLIGSCFSENMGRLFSANNFRCLINPFGILYNPESIAVELSQLIERKVYSECDLMEFGGAWMSLMHHGRFSSPDRDSCLNMINDSLSQGADFLRVADWLILTFGTARVYEWRLSGQTVGNCHKLPERLFRRRLLEVDEITECYVKLLSRIREINPKLKVMLTVSPVRHSKDGLHGNQVSKATLLIAVDKLCGILPQCFYFPSYEIVIDELRDYRFYDSDMVHPSQQAVDYVWECFSRSYFSTETLACLKEWGAIRRALDHVPRFPDSDEYLRFKKQLDRRIELFNEKYGNR